MLPMQVSTPSPASSTFERQLADAVDRLRGALADVLASVDADSTRPQDMSRRFRLNKNLTWKVSKIIHASDVGTPLQHLPGEAGVAILLDALARAGAPDAACAAVRAAVAGLDDVVQVHTGDRATLELILDGLTPEGFGGERLERSRALAFRGNSGIWGVQARVKTTMAILAPSREAPDRIDAAVVGGYRGFRRLRPTPAWPLFRVRPYRDDGSDPAHACVSRPLRGESYLLSEFCSQTMPGLTVVREGAEDVFELGDGPIGNTGQFDCVFGSLARDVGPRYREPGDTGGELYSIVSCPVETLVFDLVAHRDLAFALRPTVDIVSRLDGRLRPPGMRPLRDLLPIEETATDLGFGPPAFATPLAPGAPEIASVAFESFGHDPRDFGAVRLTVKFPPMPSTVVLRFDLPERP
jgi:hypothetical protein